jgi:peptidoglycan-N-acetylmuramic acid deacetylase
MLIKRTVLVMLALALALLACGCGKKTDNRMLSDLGGVYSSDSSQIDFDDEISSGPYLIAEGETSINPDVETHGQSSGITSETVGKPGQGSLPDGSPGSDSEVNQENRPHDSGSESLPYDLETSGEPGQHNRPSGSGLDSEVNQENHSPGSDSPASEVNRQNHPDGPVSVQDNYDNKVYGWGLRRKPGNVPPDADPGAPERLAKYNAVYIGDVTQKRVYLTFDEGYENGYTPKILDVLRDNGVKAAFFITGPYLKEHEDLVRRMVEEGHTVGNHTIHHPSLPTVSDKEMEEEVLGLDRVFSEKFNKNMKFLRPPKGEYSERSLAVTSKLGYVNVFWSFAYDDWYTDKQRGADYAYNIVMENIHNGAILLLHAVSRDNAEALDRIIKGVRQEGYEFGCLDELIPE